MNVKFFPVAPGSAVEGEIARFSLPVLGIEPIAVRVLLNGNFRL